MRRALMIVVTLATGVLASCDDEPAAPPRYPFTFLTHADGDGLEGVQVTVNNSPVGVTNGEGVLRVDLTGPEGAPVRVSAVCPDGHRSIEDAQVHNLRRVQSLDPATAARGIEVTFACPPEHRSAVVVVRTHDQVGLPIMLDGREVARTDGSGAAHLAVVMTPGTAFQVLVDTRHNERLRPRSPTQTFTVPDHDDIFLVDQRFVEEAPPRRVRRRPRTVAPASRLPQRISSH
jgi:hypothetical protein